MVLKYLAIIFFALQVGLHAAAASISGIVTSVYDGDTLKVRDANGTEHDIRFSHIDTPEVNPKQDYGITARDALRVLVLGKNVVVRETGDGGYGRTSGVVYLGQMNINLEMVAKGHAWHYKDYSNDPKYAAAETQARQAKIGLWATSNPIAPWLFRKGVRPTPQTNQPPVLPPTPPQTNQPPVLPPPPPQTNQPPVLTPPLKPTIKTFMPGTSISSGNRLDVLSVNKMNQLRLGLRTGNKVPSSMMPKGTATSPSPRGLFLNKPPKLEVKNYRPKLFDNTPKQRFSSGRVRKRPSNSVGNIR